MGVRRLVTVWGATDEERARSLPGDDVVPHSLRTATNAVTIAAPAEAVWPWIVQMGQDRAGFYTYTWIERLLGTGIRNAERIEPAWQHLEVGDRVWLTPRRYLGRPGQFWTVHALDPLHVLVLVQSLPDNPTAGTWGLVLDDAGPGRTRLLSRHTAAPPGVSAGCSGQPVPRSWSGGCCTASRTAQDDRPPCPDRPARSAASRSQPATSASVSAGSCASSWCTRPVRGLRSRPGG